MSLFVPGDVCDTHAFLLPKMDHSIGALTAVRFAEVPSDALVDLLDRHPQITRALSCDRLVQVAVQREAIVSLGRRSGEERIAHLLCEMFLRLRAVGLTDGDTCPMPLSQVELASALGQSTVHINRTLQALRASRLIVLKGRRLTILDFDALQKVALFNPSYLHLDYKRNATV
jgi:CRP-like cAMP-binding protein